LESRLSYRVLESDDLPGLQRLWEEETEWGPLEPVFRHWYQDNPCPGSFGVVAADDSFIALPVTVNGRTVRAVRTFAPILSQSLRQPYPGQVPLEPILRMYQHGQAQLRERGHSLIFGLPEPRWRGFLRLFPDARCETFPLWSLPLPLAGPLSLGDGYSAAPLTAWDERVDRLWDSTARFAGCSVTRDARTLRWKTAGLEVTAIARDGTLRGVVASGPKGEKPRQWEICDLLSADTGESLTATLRAAINLGHAKALEATGDTPIRQVSVLAAPHLEAALGGLGFRRDAYEFPIVVRRLDETLTDDEIAPERWYLSAND